MFSRAGIVAYRNRAVISQAWRLSETVNKSPCVLACFQVRQSSFSLSSALDAVYPNHESFAKRHIGPNDNEQAAMLDFLGLELQDLLSVSEYEEMRKRNLEDNKVMLAKLKFDIQGLMPIKQHTPRAKKQKASVSGEEIGAMRRNPSRNARYQPTRYDLPRTRSRSGSVSSVSSSTSSTPLSTPEKLVVRFGFFQKAPSLDFDSQLGRDSDVDLPSPSRQPRVSCDTRSAEEITEDDLNMVATTVSEKRYDSVHGTSCHQCRQKTDDLKTICRSKRCGGVRGQFCGPCLRNRYGEDARAALKNPEWACPPCRGICNCSFCRRRNGKGCTGILIHLARERGYNDVHSYLKGLMSSK